MVGKITEANRVKILKCSPGLTAQSGSLGEEIFLEPNEEWQSFINLLLPPGQYINLLSEFGAPESLEIVQRELYFEGIEGGVRINGEDFLGGSSIGYCFGVWWQGS